MKMELSPQNNMLWGFQPPRLALLGGERICKHMEENSSQASVCQKNSYLACSSFFENKCDFSRMTSRTPQKNSYLVVSS